MIKTNKKIGLLGGSFNPAHKGHVHISLHAIEQLNLDEVWWLISPQNPQKSAEGMHDINVRKSSCEVLTKNILNIQLKTIETEYRKSYTCDIIPIIQELYSDTNFVWLMGADNLINFHKWKKWEYILGQIPVAIFDRIPYTHHSIASTTAISYSQARILKPDNLISAHVPAWCYMRTPTIDISSTHIRKQSS